MSMASEDPTGIDIPTGKTYLTERQVRDMSQEIAQIESMLSDPKARIEDRGAMLQHLRRTNADLDRNAPPEATPEQRDRLAKEAKGLLANIREGMPSYEEMRKNPPGAVGKHRRWEALNKARILRWKNIRRILHRGDDDPDVANLEMYRPRGSTLNMDNAEIPGKQFFIPPNTEAYREGYERTFGGGEASPESVEALMKKVEDLEKQLQGAAAPAPVEKPKKAKKKVDPNKPRPFSATAPCGRVFHATVQHRADFAVLGHRRGCDECKAKQGETA